MTPSTSASDRRGAPAPRPPGAAFVRVAALAVALVLVIVCAVALLLSWLPGDAPDLYGQVDADVSCRIGAADAGTGSATILVLESRAA